LRPEYGAIFLWLTQLQRSAATMTGHYWFLTYGAGHPHSLARAAAKGYRGLNEKIAPVSVKSLTA